MPSTLGIPGLQNLYEFPEGYRLVVPPKGSIVMECPHGHVAVYTHHFEFGLRFSFDYFLVKILNAFNVHLGSANPLSGPQPDRLHLDHLVFGLLGNLELVTASSLVEEEWFCSLPRMLVVNYFRQEVNDPTKDEWFERLATRFFLVASSCSLCGAIIYLR